jgi:sporulation protein YhbH
MLPVLTLSHNDWSLHRKGPIDLARHNAKVKEAIRGDLPAIVGEEAIITADGDKIVKIPIRSLELPRFRFGQNDQDQVGQGSGGSRPGDTIGQTPGSNAPGQGTGAGEQPGLDYYEAELTVDEIAALVFEDLGLPFLQPKEKHQLKSEVPRFTEVRRAGPMSNLDKRHTIMENLRRNARAGRPHFGGIVNDDLRFRTWEPTVVEENNAVVIAMRDVSGSMGEFQKYITRSFYFWMVRFLRTTYTNVEIVFITHHTEAKEVDENAFFHLGESGGTRVSSAYQLALEIIEQRYNPSIWNIYAFHFSDGDNWGAVDNQRCLELVKGILARANAFGYGEIQQHSRGSPTTLMSAFEPLTDPHFVRVKIGAKEEVYPALRTFFGPAVGQTGSVAALRVG